MQIVKFMPRAGSPSKHLINGVALVVLVSTPSLGICLSAGSSSNQAKTVFSLDTLPRDALEARGKHLLPAAISDSNDAKNGRGYRPDLGDLDTQGVDSTRRDPVVISVTKRPRYVSDPVLHAREFDDHKADNHDAPAVVRRLQALQARYQRLVDAGGWPAIPDGPTVGIGQQDDRLIAVRARLALTDDLESAAGDATLDSALSAALSRFQQRVRLPVSGELDAATLRELNVPAHQRLMSIALSLSRTHELPHGDQEYVLVNIAGYTASYQRGDKLLWSGRTMVGTTATRTPQLVSAIDRMVFNPTWIVPNGIATRSVLPAVIDDPAYLARKNMRVFDMQWKPVDPTSVDWEAVHASRERDIYIRQDAGGDNALGKVKFMFPNTYSVYLHDTPSKHLFDQSMRAFSNGCVRLENPMALAAAMLDHQGLDGDAMRQSAELGGRPEVVNLERPVPVHMLYLTVELGDQGEAIFHPDVYEYDSAQTIAQL